jgi:putative nucleotidyltransferase with HDIG domain
MSGFADQLQFANCLSVAHRYLLKPFDLADFVQFLEGLARFRSIIQNPKLLRITGALGALPSPPEMYLKLTRLLNSPYSSLTDVAEVLEQDPSLTSKLLQIANSAFYGLGRKVINPSEAVQYLGVEVIRDLVLGVEAFSKWQKNPAVKAVPQSLWDHSLRTALGARRIASTFQNREWADLAFLGGLLHDIGKLILMLNIPDEYTDTLSMAERYRLPVVEAEQRRFGANHAQIGAYLLGLWGLPLPVVQLVEHHHSLRSYPDEQIVPLLAVHAAQCLDPVQPREDQLNLDYLRELGYESAIPQWRDLLGVKAANPVA